MLEEIRIGSLGVIESSTLELGPGLTVITGETGAGKTMIVTALGLLLGGRADSGAVRSGARTARIEGVVRAEDLAPFASAVEDAGGEVEDGRVVLARNVSAEGRSRAFVGGASVPVSVLADVAEPLVAVHGQSDQHRLLRPRRPARGARPVRRGAGGRAAGDVEGPARPAGADRARARRGRRQRAGPRPRGRPAALRARRDRGRLPGAGGGHDAGGRGVAAGLRRHAAHRRRAGPRGPVQRAGPARRTGHHRRGALAPRRRARARPRGGRARRPARRDHLPALRPRRRRRVVRHPGGDRPGPARHGLRTPVGAGRADPQVRRDHRRGARLGPGLLPSGCWSWTAPTTGSSSCAPTSAACASSWPRPAPRCPPRAPRRPPDWPARSPTS